MQNYLAIKHFQKKQVRIIRYDDKFYFVGNDVAKILGYKKLNQAIHDNVDSDDWKSLKYRACRNSRLANLWGKNDFSNKILVNESGVYALIFGSKLPEAKKFKRWVTHEVLPKIRETGGYQVAEQTPSYQITDPVKRAEQWIKEKRHEERLADDNKEHRELERVFRSTKRNVPVDRVAKVISNTGYIIGRNNFFKWLRQHKFLISHGREKNVPYQKWIAQGLFKVTEYTKRDANPILCHTVLVTPKGQQYLVKAFLESVSLFEAKR